MRLGGGPDQAAGGGRGRVDQGRRCFFVPFSGNEADFDAVVGEVEVTALFDEVTRQAHNGSAAVGPRSGSSQSRVSTAGVWLSSTRTSGPVTWKAHTRSEASYCNNPSTWMRAPFSIQRPGAEVMMSFM